MLIALRNLTVPLIAGALGWRVAVVLAWAVAVIVNELWLDYQRILRWRVAARLPPLAGRDAGRTLAGSAALACIVWGPSCGLTYLVAYAGRALML